MKVSILLLLLNLIGAPLVAEAQLTVASKTTTPPESSPFEYLEVQFERDTFTIVPPPQMRIQTDAHIGMVRFFSRTGTVVVALQFSTNDAGGVLSSADAVRQFAAPQLPPCRLVEEFAANAGGYSGKGLELGYTVLARTSRSLVAVVPRAQGCVSFVLTCSDDELARGRAALGRVMTSFQCTTPAAVAVAKR